MLMQEFHDRMFVEEIKESTLEKLMQLTRESLETFFERSEAISWTQWNAV